ncbi:MAG: T9SS type A sorting domain-containing protein [Bacteroidales bacterium]|nr:T9SS type A sorting domain-containing protein [Bacteroidales bacterium]MCF8457198.1 T9SS type A sorting domain-containing protein [Bacteroidales bacterium]
MKHTFTLFLIASFLGLSYGAKAQCADPANIFTFMYDGRTYELVKETRTWEGAAACAKDRGGYLVEINSQTEQYAMYEAIIGGAGIASNYTTVSDGGGIAYIWIGATDKYSEGTWLWDGTDANSGDNFWTGQGSAGAGGGSAIGGAYINWGGSSSGPPNEPDDYAGQDAAAIALAGWPSGTNMLGSAGEWNDININNGIYYIIEYDANMGIRHDKNDNSRFMIYPSPVKDYLYINLKKANTTITEICIFNPLGELVMTEKFENSFSCRLDLHELKSGLYFARIGMANGETSTRKIIME